MSSSRQTLRRGLPVLTMAALAVGLFALSVWGEERTPKKYAVLVGVKEYAHSKLRGLRYTENDATEMAKLLRSRGYEVTLLCDSRGKEDEKLAPTKANIEREVKGVLDKARKGDLVLVGLSGHGLQFTGDKDCFFCPADARPCLRRKDSLVSLGAIYKQMEDSFAGAKILLVDACRDDPTADKSAKGVDADSAPRPPRGVVALFSCSAGERSFESDKVKHGVFFHFVLEGLRGKAPALDGEVTFGGLQLYVRRRVARGVEVLVGEGAKQTPNLKADLSGESPVLVRLGDIPTPPPPPVRVVTPKTVTNSLGMKLVLIPAGKFTMGSPESEKDRDDDETQHEVEITRPFYLGVHEVTQGEFEKVMGYNPSAYCASAKGKAGAEYKYTKPGEYAERVKGLDTSSFPVENVSWEEAQEFCKRLTESEKGRYGLLYRLPTEAEWEYSCREGGLKGGPFHFGDSLTSDLANFDGNYPYGTTKGPYLGRTTKVGSYKPNAFGLFDLHGNVWEWCADWYDEYPKGAVKDPTGPARASYRVFRGGSWGGGGRLCRSAERGSIALDDRSSGLGFRIASVPSGK